MLDISCVNDELLAYAALKNDLLFHKIPKEKYQYYIQESLKIGKEKAKQYKSKSVEQLCQENHIQISYAKQNGKFYGVQFRANIELSKEQSQIILYQSSLEEMTKASQKLFHKNTTFEEVSQIHLAHELFHFYEYIDQQSTNEILDSIVRLKIGPIQLYSTIMSTSEIAAHAFAKELLNLNYLPNIYDYILLMDNGEYSLKEFEELVGQWKTELGEIKC